MTSVHGQQLNATSTIGFVLKCSRDIQAEFLDPATQGATMSNLLNLPMNQVVSNGLELDPAHETVPKKSQDFMHHGRDLRSRIGTGNQIMHTQGFRGPQGTR